MDKFISFLNGFNVQTIVTLGALVWYLNHHLEKKIEEIRFELKQQGNRIDRQGQRTDKLYEMFIDLLKNKS